jgi:hypothetical protein
MTRIGVNFVCMFYNLLIMDYMTPPVYPGSGCACIFQIGIQVYFFLRILLYISILVTLTNPHWPILLILFS